MDNNTVTNKQYTMKKIKFINSTNIRFNGQDYKGYLIGELPKRFAFIYNEDSDQEGITDWFNYKGLTFVEYNPSIWSYL